MIVWCQAEDGLWFRATVTHSVDGKICNISRMTDDGLCCHLVSLASPEVIFHATGIRLAGFASVNSWQDKTYSLLCFELRFNNPEDEQRDTLSGPAKDENDGCGDS